MGKGRDLARERGWGVIVLWAMKCFCLLLSIRAE